MFVPMHIAPGKLTSAIASSSNLIAVNPEFYADFMQRIGVNHTYLAISNGTTVEIVRATGTANYCILAVGRAVDNTIGRAFPSSCDIRYVLTAEAIKDIVNTHQPAEVTITAGDGISVEQEFTNVFTISAVPVNLTSGDESISIIGTAPNLDIRVDSKLNSCC